MTLPTSRQRPWIFPGQREHMASHHHSAYESPIHHPELMSHNDPWSARKCEDERHRVLSALRDNHKKDRYYVANPNKNWGDNDLHKLSHPHKHPERLHGGVMTTKAGQQWGFNRLKERVDELNIRASAAFGTEANMAQPSKLPGKSGTEDAIDTAFTTLYDSVQAVEFTNAVTNAQKVLSTLYEGGDTLGTTKIGEYLDSSADIKRDLIALLDIPHEYSRDTYGVGSNRDKRTIKTVLPIMDRIIRLLDLIAKTANRSQPERKQAISSSKGRDLAEAKSRFGNTEFAENPSIYNAGLPASGVPGENPPGTTPYSASQQGFQGQRNLGYETMNLDQAKRYTGRDFEPTDLPSPVSGDLIPHTSLDAFSSPPTRAVARGPSEVTPGTIGSRADEVPPNLRRFIKIKKPTGTGKPEWVEMEFEKWANDYVHRFGRKPSKEEAQAVHWKLKEKAEHNPEADKYGSGAEQINYVADGTKYEAKKKAYTEWRNEFHNKYHRFPNRTEAEKYMKELNGGCGSCKDSDDMYGAGVGDGPVNSMDAKQMFFKKIGRYPDDDNELMEFMKAMNENSKVEVSDPGFENGKAGSSRHHHARRGRLSGRGKPKECEASHLLTMLNKAGDEVGLSGSGKKKNDSGRFR